MNFTFEQSPWELAAEKLRDGGSISAMRFLSLLEGEEEDAVEEALLELEQRRISLDVSDLPACECDGATGERLKLEQRLAGQDDLLQALDQTDPLALYLQELAATPAAGDPQLLALRLAEGEDVAQQLVAVSLHHVITMARQLTGHGVLLLDLIQEGSLGLWQGILNYTQGDYEPHIRWWIRQYLARAVVLQARENGVGGKLRDAVEAYRAADTALLTRLGRNPTLEEIALELSVSPEEAQICEDTLRSARMLEQAKPKERQPEPDDEQAVENTAYFQSRQRIGELLSGLSDEDSRLLTLRFGLEGGMPMTPQEVGKALGISAEQVISREAAALALLRGNH